jgi:serine/threonine protein kinase
MMNDNGDAMVSNFGMPPICDQIAHDVLLTTTCVVNSYVSAPELLFAIEPESVGPRGPEHSPATDAWDFGSLLLEMSSGKMPFEGVAQGRAIRWISEGRKPDPKDHPILLAEDPLWDIIMSCFSTTPRDRPTMSSLQTRVR